jgi:hypothetical protein
MRRRLGLNLLISTLAIQIVQLEEARNISFLVVLDAHLWRNNENLCSSVHAPTGTRPIHDSG